MLKLLNRLPIRIVSFLGVLVLAGIVVLTARFFPTENRNTIALVGAFGIAGIFAFTVGVRRPTKTVRDQKRPEG